MFFADADGKIAETKGKFFVDADGKYAELLPCTFYVDANGKYAELLGGGGASIIVLAKESSSGASKYSVDGGLTWENATPTNIYYFVCLATNGKRVVGTRKATSNMVAYTVDGAVWTTVSQSAATTNLNPISYIPETGKFLRAVSIQGSSGADWKVGQSDDGITWEHQTNGGITSGAGQLFPIVYDAKNNAYLCSSVGKVLRCPGTSDLMKTGWNNVLSASVNNVVVNETGTAVAHSSGNSCKMYSVNGGSAWTQVANTGSTGGYVFYGGGLFISFSNATGNNYHYYSTDGKTWNKGTSTLAIKQPGGMFYDGDKYFAISGSTVYQSLDGITWTKLADVVTGCISYLE